jgi:putative protease
VRNINYLELVCPAGTPAALRTAIDAGADTVYCGFRDCTNARNYPGLNFDDQELAEGIAYAHARGRWVLVAVNTFPRAGDLGPWRRAVDAAAAAGADAVILAAIRSSAFTCRCRRRRPIRCRSISIASNSASAGSFCRACWRFRRWRR